MTEVGITDIAQGFHPNHAVAAIHMVRNDVIGDRLRERWPTRTRFEFDRCIEQWSVTAGAGISTGLEETAHIGTERSLGTCSTCDCIGVGIETCFPLRIGSILPTWWVDISVFCQL